MNKGQFSCKLVVMIIMFWSCLSCTHLGLPWGPPLHTPSFQCWSWSTVAFDAARIEDLWGVRDSSGIYSRNLSNLRLSSCVPFDAAFKHCVRQGHPHQRCFWLCCLLPSWDDGFGTFSRILRYCWVHSLKHKSLYERMSPQK